MCLDKRQLLTGLSYQKLKVSEWLVMFLQDCQLLTHLTIDDRSFTYLELTIRGGHCSPYTYPKAISMIEKKQLPLEVCVYFHNTNSALND